ncbi:hypothetical protein EYC80_003034 [Monilinia laxa]|uniref:Uncharacterized protein n=1 Tax=Monilinia laxa TaxID=61186 RepID=A0A5N6KCG1_MONLA|nr:hypothetical protein EYC80_003034 [Monilinia laxa]
MEVERAESREQRAESREQRAESREQRAEGEGEGEGDEEFADLACLQIQVSSMDEWMDGWMDGRMVAWLNG